MSIYCTISEILKGNAKRRNWVVWGVRGHLRSLAMSPFGKACTNVYCTLTETMRISCTVFGPSEKLSYFNLPHLHLAPLLRMTLNFSQTFGIRELQSLGSHLAPGGVCVSRFDTIPLCDRQTDTETHTRRQHIQR